jgi:hypothetical protein
MAGWGAMMGLGQSLQQVGGMLLDNHKSKMKEKLELEREQRAEANTVARENRAQTRLETTPDPKNTRYVENAEGVLMEQVRSGTGAILEERLAPPNVVAERKREAEKDALDREGKLLDIQGKRFDVENADTLLDLTIQGKRASIEASLAGADSSRANAAYTRAGKAAGIEGSITGTPARSEVVSEILKDLGSYGDKVDKVRLTEIADQAVTHMETMKKQGIVVDPIQWSRTVIANQYGSKPKSTTASPAGINWR